MKLYNKALKNNFKGFELSDKNGKLLTEKKFEYLVRLDSRYYAFSELLGRYESYESHTLGPHNIKQDNSINFSNRSLFDLQQNKKILGQYTDFRLVGENIFACQDTILQPRGIVTQQQLNVKYNINYSPFPNEKEDKNENEWKLIDIGGNQIAIPEGLIIVEPYYNRIAVKKEIDSSGRYLHGLIEVDGSIIVPVRYEQVEPLGFNSYMVMNNGLWGIYYTSTQIEVPCQYDEIINRLYQSGMYRVNQKGKWGYIDPLGNMIIPCIYDANRHKFTNGRLRVDLNNESFTIDKKGNRVVLLN